MKKETLILDTSLFVNPASSLAFGPTPTEAFRSFLELAKTVKNVDFYMAPSVYDELMHFVEESKIPQALLLAVTKKPPKKHELKVPGFLIYTLVENMRDRVDRGLRLAERHVREALLKNPAPGGADAADKKIRPDAEIVGRLRESYRRIMREGMLDSRADVDLLLLAYETGGTVVSADQGVLLWAENLGISHLAYDHLKEFLKEASARVSP